MRALMHGNGSFRKRTSWLLIFLLISPALAHPQSDHAGSFSAIDQVVAAAIREQRMPGAVVLVGHAGRIVFERAYGRRAVEPASEPMTVDTIFDLASLTKPLITATAVMQLFEQGQLRLDDPVSHYLPAFAAEGKQDITIRQLLTHYSGLPPDLSLAEPWRGRAEGVRRALAIAPLTPPGVQFRYSDVNYIVLGALVEKLSGLPLETYAQQRILHPLGLSRSRFLPPSSWRARIAPTEYDERGVMLRGVVEDPTARRMGGVAGHAGLFATARDLSTYAQSLLDRLQGRPSRFPLRRITLEKMVTPGQPPTGTALRGLGWDIESPFSSNRGELFPVGSFGHTGYTGTSLWIDPISDSYVIVLSNAVHPRGEVSISDVRGKIANVVAAAIGVPPGQTNFAATLTGYNEAMSGMRRWADRNGDVRTGIDVLEADHFAELATLALKHGHRLRLGLVTNQTGLDIQGRRTIDVLAQQAPAEVPGLHLDLILSPEHGIAGDRETEKIPSSTDPATGLPVMSLYGATEKERRPSLATLRSLDAIVVDLQDAGVRYFTYETLVLYVLEAAAQTNTDVVILDRPNPLGGAFLQGPVSDPGRASYVDPMPLPVRHGMTLGELARFFNGEEGLHAPLTVVRMQGWQRGDWYDSTGLAWIRPSPNLRAERQVILYPATGLIEGANLSVGRGTDSAFEELGAPWIDGRALASNLNHRFLPGIRFVPIAFTPAGPYPYAGQLCHGVGLLVTNRNVLDAPELGIEVAAMLHRLYPDQFLLEKIEPLVANHAVMDALSRGEDPQRIAESWEEQLRAFSMLRAKYLLY
jgi:uncharacterized protein YbbC (DUF1343 family)/CubicO group peptidase (beta-lactamase class C family)